MPDVLRRLLAAARPTPPPRALASSIADRARAVARAAAPAARWGAAVVKARPEVVLAACLLLGVIIMVVHWAP